MSAEEQYNKAAISQAFGRAAPTYDAHATLQRAVGKQLNTLFDFAQEPETLLDIGCGTGFMAAHWQRQHTEVCALDLSLDMLNVAKAKNSASWYVQADAEQLPFANSSFSACCSNLSLQWCQDLKRPVTEMYRVLKQQGCAIFSTLIAGSLNELSMAWQSIDQASHVNGFLSQEQLLQVLSSIGADKSQYVTATHTMWYPSVLSMMQDLKGIGATHIHKNRRQGLLTRSHLLALEEAMQPFKNEQGLLPLSYHIFYGILQRE